MSNCTSSEDLTVPNNMHHQLHQNENTILRKKPKNLQMCKVGNSENCRIKLNKTNSAIANQYLNLSQCYQHINTRGKKIKPLHGMHQRISLVQVHQSCDPNERKSSLTRPRSGGSRHHFMLHDMVRRMVFHLFSFLQLV